jgi:PKD repeat protein
MKEIRQKLTTIVVTIALVLTAFFVMATPISRDEVEACAGVDQEVDAGIPVYFDASCSLGVGTLSYMWYFGDGNTGLGVSPVHIFNQATAMQNEGIYNVTLVVKDGNNVTDLDTVQITVKNHYPTAEAGSDQFVSEDQTVLFNASGSSDVDNDIVSAKWDFGDGSFVFTNKNATIGHAYEKAGEYPVTLTITDDNGAIDKDTIFVEVKNLAPIADGLADGETDDDISIFEDETVHFNALWSSDTPSDMPTLEYSWDYGDGSKGSGMTPSHRYTKQGLYNATLTVTDDNGLSDHDIMIIRVFNAPPSAEAGNDQIVDEGDTVFFDASGTWDTRSDEVILDYSWSLGESGTHPTHGWYDDGVNNVDLVVTDDDGLQDMDSMTVAVENVPPVAGINGAYALVDFTLRASGEKWHNVIVTIGESSVETPVVEVLRTPGSPNDQMRTAEDVHVNIAEEVSATVHYTPLDDPVNGSPNGATPVWLTLTYEDGTSYTLFKSFNVQKPQEWTWVHDMNEYVLEQPLHFSGVVYDPGADDIHVEWDFGDGTAPIINDYVSGGNHPMRINEHHVHMFPFGVFTMTLEATDDDGATGAMSITVTKSDSLSSTNIAPSATSSGGGTVLEDEQLTLVGVGNDTGSDIGILTYAWDLGDGTIANTPTVNHSYAKAGTYYPTLIVQDDEGAIGITSELVEVLNVIPTAVATADQVDVYEDDVISFDASSSTDTPTDLSIIKYAWDYGDGSKEYGIDTTHVYSKMGTYVVTLTVTDDNGASDTSQLTITVKNEVPFDLDIISDQYYHEDQLIFFKASVMDTPTDIPLHTYKWSFGDGTTGNGRNPGHAYGDTGFYPISLKVTDDDGDYAETTFIVGILNPVPIAYGGLTKNLYGNQMEVTFEGRGFDTHSDQSTLSYMWHFGDGSGSISPSPTHVYPTTGAESYTAMLEVTDIHGASDSYQVTVNVKVDSDGDQLLDDEEYALGTDPFNYDTDGDWLIDYYEINPPGGKPETDPKKADGDKDGCTDWEEIWPGRDGYITDPEDPDMDSDGLKDCEEVYRKEFKSVKRFSIGNPSTGEGVVQVSLSDVGTSAPVTQLIAAEAKVGISHDDIQELKITLTNDFGGIVLRDREFPGPNESAVNLFTSYDLISVGFHTTDFTQILTWTLTVEDQVAGNPKGFIEYFEIHIIVALNPMDLDTDNDGLIDYEEVNPGDDGWFTDPWLNDTDGDGLSDYLEPRGWNFLLSKTPYEDPTGFKTDPTRNDTDRDGVNDADDWDPLHNMMVEVALGDFTPLDDDPDGTGGGKDVEAFIGIGVGIDHIIEQQMIWTDRRTMDKDVTVDLGRQYTFEVDDSSRFHHVIITAYDDDSSATDDMLDIYHGPPNLWEADYDLIQGTPRFTFDDGIYEIGNGGNDGENTDQDARLEWWITTIRPSRIRTLMVNSTDAVSLYSAADSTFRYHGEQEYYLFILDVTTASIQFPIGYSAIIVPRTVFVNSNLSWTINNTSPLPPHIADLGFSANDEVSEETTGSVVGVLRGEVTAAQARNILYMLLFNESGSRIAEWRNVTDQLLILNLDDYLLSIIPFIGVRFSNETGEDPDDGWESASERLKELLESIAFVLLVVLDFFKRMTSMLLELGMWIIDKIMDALSAVLDAINYIIGLILDFMVAIIDWVIDIIVSKLLPAMSTIIIFILQNLGSESLETLGTAVVTRIFNSMGYVLTWIADDFLPGMVNIIKGMLNAGSEILDILNGFGECIGDLALEALGDVPGQACSEMITALLDLGKTMGDIVNESLNMIGTGLAATLYIVLDWCGVTDTDRPLNTSERDAVQAVFGYSIDVDMITVGDVAGCNEYLGMLQETYTDPRAFTVGYIITVPPGAEWDEVVAVHESTHIWQYKEDGLDYIINSILDQAIDPDCYNYGYDNAENGEGGQVELLDANGDFDVFNVEQQAQIIEHYYVRKYVEGLPYDEWQPYADIVYDPTP